MGSRGICDKVAIVAMGCTTFGEHWDKSLDDLIIDASIEAFSGTELTKDDIDAFWIGTAQSGMSGITLSKPLQLVNKPVTRVENYCTSGSEALRAAAYAVASGAYDVAMAVGAEKVKDSGYQGLNQFPIPGDGTGRTLTAARAFEAASADCKIRDFNESISCSLATIRLAKVSAARVSSMALSVSPFWLAASAMITAWRADAVTLSSSSMARLSFISACL